MGASAGGMAAFTRVLSHLGEGCPLPIIAVQHMSPTLDAGEWAQLLDRGCAATVREAAAREPVQPGRVYFAPANYGSIRVSQRRNVSM